MNTMAKKTSKGGKTTSKAGKKISGKTPRAGRQKAKSGTPFEKRAQEALQFVHSALKAEHDVRLPMRYGDWPRQFDVALRSGEQVRKVYEAKDYKSRVPFEKVEAFETKVREMKMPPLDGAGVISAHGFQEGPIARARDLGSEVLVRELYELREVREEDWQNWIKSAQFQILVHSLDASGVHLTLADGEAVPAAGVAFSLDRAASFLYDATGHIKGNVLDQINDRLRAVRVVLSTKDADDPPAPYGTIAIEFDDDMFMRFGRSLVRVRRIEFTPARRDLRTSINVDFSTCARDTLIDTLSEQRWIIPDPEKAVSASRQGYDVALTYKRKADANLEALSLPSQPENAQDRWNAQLANAIQTQALLRVLGRAPKELSEHGPSAELSRKLDQATKLLRAGHHEAAKALYWETCAVATSLVALVNLTFIYESEKDLDQAFALALRTIEIFPLEVDGFKNYAAICMARGKLDDARTILDAARTLHAGAPELLRKEAELLRYERNWSQAAEAFSQLCAIDRSDSISRLNLAVCEGKQGLHDEAAWDALEAFRLGLNSPDLVWHVMGLLHRARRFGDAVAVGSATIAKAAPNVSAALLDDLRVQTALAAYEAGQCDMAETLIDPVHGETPLLAYLRGLLHHTRGATRAAYEAFQRYVAARPDERGGLHNLSVTATDAGLYEAAHAALRAPAFESEDTGDFWTMRAMTAARAGDHADAERSAERAATHGVDAAALLMEGSDAAFQAGQGATGAQLQMAALRFNSDDGRTIVKQIHMRVWLLEQGKATVDEIDRELNRAEHQGVDKVALVFTRMMMALSSGRAEQIATLTPLVLEAEFTGFQALVLAVEAEARARSELALCLLDRYRPEPVTGSRVFRLPHPDAVRAAALLRLRRPLDEVGPIIERLASLDDPHPYHDVVTAYWLYGKGELERALALLDRAGELTQLADKMELSLRLQCLVELARYKTAAALLRTYFPELPVAGCSAWWSRDGDWDPAKLQALVAARPQLAGALGMASQMRRDTEHALLLIKNGALSPAVAAADTWEGAFVWARDLGDEYTPIFVRVAAAPLATIQRLLGHPTG